MSPGERELEICAETLQACVAAEEGGADRVELCSGLDEGGVTPSHGLIRAALMQVKLPVHILLRPRGGDFVYSEAEFAAMCEDLRHAASLGVAGFVAGCLTHGHEVDEPRMQTLVRLAEDRTVTFHRAFDRAADLDRALESLVSCGCSRLLTSGGAPSVAQGRDRLADVVNSANGRIRVAAGGGVRLGNAQSLCEIAGLDLHASLRNEIPVRPEAPNLDPLWRQTDTGTSQVSVKTVRGLAGIVHRGSLRHSVAG